MRRLLPIRLHRKSPRLEQRVDGVGGAETAEYGGDKADRTDFAVGKTFQWRFRGIDGFDAFGYAEVAEAFADDTGERAAVGFGDIGQFNL